MLKGPFRIYKEYQIVYKSILSDLATNAIKFYHYDSLKCIPYIWAHKYLFCRTYKQTETIRRTARKLLTNLMGQLSNRRLVSTVLETKSGVDTPFRKLDYVFITKDWELSLISTISIVRSGSMKEIES